MSNIAVKRLSDALGCEIAGLRISPSLSEPEFKAVEDALHEHLVVIVRGQELSPHDFVAFAKRFGRPEPHVIDQFHHQADANILILSNRKNERGEPLGLADGGTYFHSDYSYLPVPARCTLLYGIETPGEDAGTTFANQRRAYEELPDAQKNRIAGLVCRHRYGNRDNLDEQSRTAASKLTQDQKDKMTWVRHPLVRKHPHTGRKALYAVSGSSFGIEGMDDRVGVSLLDSLKHHATAARYCHTPAYRPGDIVIWDNCSLLHAAPLIDPNRPRTLWRITVKEQRPTL
ncbi:MAG: TauD/TfdA dioxygenase family protein [Hyphomicrobiaceae bacterium]